MANKYSGISASIVAHIKNTKTPFSIDIGVGDIIVPNQVKRVIPTQLSGFHSPLINTYSIETTVAEKIDAILNLMEFSSRMKDYYDIFYLANEFDFDGAHLSEALNKTFINRGRKFSTKQFKDMTNFYNNSDMQIKWNAFVKKIDLGAISLKNVLDTIDTFLSRPIYAIIEGKPFEETWIASENRWIKTY